jgi:hypothetical protein
MEKMKKHVNSEVYGPLSLCVILPSSRNIGVDFLPASRQLLLSLVPNIDKS